MDRLTSMATFVKAVDLGSFAAAADVLEMSAPMVGKHVRFLEERLGVRLLHRTTRRQSLTEAGQAYYERCRAVLAEAEAADALASEQLSEPRGRLRVTMPALLGRHCVVPVLLKLAQKYPALELDLSFGDPIADLIEGGYDLAIRTGDLTDQPGLIGRRIARRMARSIPGAASFAKPAGSPRLRSVIRVAPAPAFSISTSVDGAAASIARASSRVTSGITRPPRSRRPLRRLRRA